MSRMTIDFGIDLGTTNSCVAVLKGTDTEVIKKDGEYDLTPSVVWLDKNENFHVGLQAKARLMHPSESKNVFYEFKIRMGESAEYVFARNSRRMKPEELSAEVLKSLRADVAQRLSEDLQAAVITVPAAFDTPQCNATMRAAQIAGIRHSPLLQEPVAAAMAYGFQNESSKAMWLVYDLGGGTFDAAIIQVRDGLIRVVNHGGDNYLGGKLFDWAIVDQLLVPHLSENYNLRDFHLRNKEKWEVKFNAIKWASEDAKKILSNKAEVFINDPFFNHPWQDDDGLTVELDSYKLRRSDIERIAESHILRTINICKKVLSEKNLDPGDIEKILLVGGPTQAPYLKEMLTAHLGIPLEFSIDPMTVVARGAAIFAGTQRLDVSAGKPVRAGQYRIELDYQPIGPDIDPHVSGKISSNESEDFSGFTLEFTNSEAHPPWRSGRVQLTSNGGFIATLWAEKGRQNIFHMELFDPKGSRCDITPDQFPYTVGITVTEQILPHGIQVARANNETRLLFEKVTPIEARKRRVVFHTTNELRRGHRDQKIKIPIIEGSRGKANRNIELGSLEIHAHQVKRDVPAGSEVELDIVIDQNRTVLVRAFIPILDEEFETTFNMEDYRKKPVENLREDFEREKERLDEVKGTTQEIEHSDAQELLDRIEEERLMDDIRTALDSGESGMTNARLVELKARIDEIEDVIEWPALLAEAQDQFDYTRDVVSRHGNDEEKRRLASLEQETRRAIVSRNPEILNKRISELWGLRLHILWEQPKFVVDIFYELESRKEGMENQPLAQQLIGEGNRAINNGDFKTLRSQVDQLLNLLPEEAKMEAQRKAFGSTVM